MAKVVIVTGASAGLGRAIALRFAKAGAKLGLIARDAERLEGLKSEIENLGTKAEWVALDVVDHEALIQAADVFETKLGPIDIWVNNAMVTVESEVVDIKPEEYRRVTDVCYHGFVFGSKAALSKMYPRNRGVIVLVGSALAYRGIPLQAAYCGAKHAIQGFSEALRTELMHQRKKIYVTMVQMPALNTPQFAWCKTKMKTEPQPVPPIFQPEVGAEAVFWSAHHPRKREIILGGRNVLIVWGNKFFPGWADWYLAKTGYQSQTTGKPISPERKDNLWETVKGDYQSRGTFNQQACKKSFQLYLVTHPQLFWMVLAIVIALLILYA